MQDDAERVHVRLRAGHTAVRGAYQLRRRPQGVPEEFRLTLVLLGGEAAQRAQAKIRDLQHPPAGDDAVGTLEIPVHFELALVEVGHPLDQVEH